jgi:dihydrofolate reductase
MRNVVYAVGISLDGYIARRDHSVDFLFMPEDYSMEPLFESIDAVIMGRKTYDVSLAMGGSYGSSMPAYVYSRTMQPDAKPGITVMSGPPAPLLSSLRSKPGKDIWLMGGGEMARQFLDQDLVDELYLGVVPVLIGDGIPAFPGGFPERKFELLENRSFSKGMIALKYRRTH